MYRVVLFVLTILMLSACAQLSAPEPLAIRDMSAGCANFNDPFYDTIYQSGSVFYSPFRAGETLSVVATSTRETTLYFEVLDKGNHQTLASWTAARDQELRYVFSTDHTDVEVFWAVGADKAQWTIACR